MTGAQRRLPGRHREPGPSVWTRVTAWLVWAGLAAFVGGFWGAVGWGAYRAVVGILP